MNEPLDRIEWVGAETLTANDYNPNRLHKPEAKLLEDNLLTVGWVQPILAREADRAIIDGFHRWRLMQDAPRLVKRWHGLVPVTLLDVTRREAMVITVRMNRAKGTHIAVDMSRLVRELHTVHGMTVQELRQAIGASTEEVEVLLAEDVFVARDIASWKYSNAWYPEHVSADR